MIDSITINREPNNFESTMESWVKEPNFVLEFSHGDYFDEKNDNPGETLVLRKKIFTSPGSYEVYPIITEEVFRMCYERWIVAKGLDR